MKNRTIAIVFAVLFVTVSGGLGLMIVRSAKRETAPVAAKPVAIEVAKAVVEVAKPENDQDRFEREDREIMRLIGIHHREESRIKILTFLETHAQKDTLKSTPGEALAIARILARSIVISGDPERRDFDKFHLVVNGFFVRSGHRSVYTDWFQEVADETN